MTQTGKVAVVTGAANGVGLAVSRQFHAKGACVVLVDRDGAALERAVAGLDPDRALAVQADVSREEDAANYAEQAVRRFGRIDMFHNNAAIVGPQVQLLD